MLERRRKVEIVLDVVLARPDEMDGRSHRTGDQRGLDDEIVKRLSAERPADERDVDPHGVYREAECLSEEIPDTLGVLRRCPHLAAAVGDLGHGVRTSGACARCGT